MSLDEVDLHNNMAIGLINPKPQDKQGVLTHQGLCHLECVLLGPE